MSTPGVYMRRRQANALESARQAAMRIGKVEPIVAPISVVWAEPPAEVLPDVPKGHCPKCAKYIGKGLHFHKRACKGAANADAA